MLKKILCHVTLLLFLGIGFASMPGLGHATGACVDLGEKLPQGVDRRLVLADLLGHGPENTEDIHMGVLHHPSAPKIYILWAWENGTLYVGGLQLSHKIPQDQWAIEPLLKISSLSDLPEKFDCTAYRLGALGHVFGFKMYERGMYSGGGYGVEHLWLFADYKGRLRDILHTFIKINQVIAGEFTKNGFREKFIIDSEATVRPIGVKRIPDLEKITLIREEHVKSSRKSSILKKKHRQRFIWDTHKNAYETQDAGYITQSGQPLDDY